MALESKEGLRAFLNSTEFGVTVILDPDFSRKEIPGVFDNEFLILDQELNAVATSDPNVMVVSEDIQDLVQWDIVEINDIAYSVKEIQPDGTGMTILMLAKSD